MRLKAYYNHGPKLEDTYIYYNRPDLQIVGVFDGHGNDFTSKFLAQHFCSVFLSTPASGTIQERLLQTFQFLEYKLIESNQEESGSTACVAIITPSFIYIANTGDSRCFFIDANYRAIDVTVDHKPTEPTEYKRIVECDEHSLVQFYGVYRLGGLAVSRTMNDYSIKKTCNSLIFHPDIFKVPQSHVKELILATDGIFDVLSNQQVVNALYTKRNATPSKQVDHLVSLAKKKGSEDDITVLWMAH